MTHRETPPTDAPAPPDPGPDALPEGAEAPPPGVRTMAVVRWALVALMAVTAGAAWVHWAGVLPATARAAVQYRCPMHPTVLQGVPGSCPICGMDLVSAAGAAQPTARAAQPADAGAVGKYWCPMHPEVASDDPAARCDKCGGMKLLPREQPAASAGVPGLVPVELAAERTQLMGMRTALVRRERLVPQLRTVGFVSANEAAVALVTARYTGWIETLAVAQAGQRVARGQLLATAYSPELIAAQQVFLNAIRWSEQQAPAAVPGAERKRAAPSAGEADARRRLELLGVAPEDVDALARSGQVLNALPIRAPVAGYVARRSALVGLYVQPGTELFQIADLSTVWVVADVFEADAGRVHVGQPARLSLSAHPGATFAGRVQFVYPAVNPETHTLQARIEFRNPELRLRPGMYGDVVLDLAPAEGLAVPVDAVVDGGEVQYVFVARDGGRFEPRRVRLGARADGRVQVLDGVAEGERVVTTANFLIDSESRLRAAVESYQAPSAEQERREREGDDRHEHARADGR